MAPDKRSIQINIFHTIFDLITAHTPLSAQSSSSVVFRFVLRFYGPVNPLGSCRARSVYLTTLYWAGLVLYAVNQYCAHSFARNWQLPFFNQQKGENDRRKYFMINLHERMLPTSAGVEPATSWSPVGRRIQLSHWGRHSLQITASVLFVYFFVKAYVVGTHLNCIHLSMQFKWVPTTYAFF